MQLYQLCTAGYPTGNGASPDRDLLPPGFPLFLSSQGTLASHHKHFKYSVQLFTRPQYRATIQTSTGDVGGYIFLPNAHKHHSLWDTGSSLITSAGSDYYSLFAVGSRGSVSVFPPVLLQTATPYHTDSAFLSGLLSSVC